VSADRWTTVRVSSGSRAAAAAVLFENGAEAIQDTDDAIITHLRRVDRDALTAAVHGVDPSARIDFEPTPDVDWSSAWRARLAAHRVDRLVVTPPWLADQFGPAERIVIEPAMAFGTGDHESTRGVLRLMQRVVRANDAVADLGAGSAVLSIAAARLGARRVVAIEVDGDAIGNAQENVDRNGVGDVVSVLEGDAATLLRLVAPVRVVLANIVSAVLVELLSPVGECITADGRAVLGGMLVEERGTMEHALAAAGWRVEDSVAENAWWSATIARR
jgi:ribosomal protein L11 methyltransferase